MTRAGADADVAGRVAIVTGASSGLGARIAEALAQEGANVVLFARSRPDLEEVAARCRRAGGDATVVPGDVTVPADCAACADAAARRFGRLDLVVACAGVGMWARFDDVADPALLRRIMDVNYGGVVNTFHAALPHLRPGGGTLVAISSVQGRIPVPYHTGYTASKHAVQGFCDALRLELGGSGVHVLTVLAHWIRGTRLRERALGPGGAARGADAPGHGADAVDPEEVARAVLRAVREGRRSVYVPGRFRYVALLSALAPSLVERFVLRRVERERRTARR